MKLSSRSGVARISAVWMISVIVLFFVALVFAFIANSDMKAAETARDAALVETQQAQQDRDAALLKLDALSESVGWFDTTGGGLKSSNVEQLQSKLLDWRDEVNAGADIATLEGLYPELLAARDRLQTEVNTLQQRIGQLDGEIQSANQSRVAIAGQKDQLIAQLTTEKSDDADNARERQTELEDNNESQRETISRLDRELRAAQAEIERLDLQMKRERGNYQARVAQMAAALAPLRGDLVNQVDATVLEVSEKLPLGWIDIGANNRLPVGTTFDVYGGQLDTGAPKARAIVSRTEANKAEVVFSDVADPYSPVVTGDVLKNPIYDPNGEHNAILVGRFDGQYNEKQLGYLLERIGITVQSQWDVTTHYMIVGTEMWVDADGEPLEEPMQPSELAAYKNAEANGVVVIPIADLREYFKI